MADRADVAELVRATRFVTDIAWRYDQRSDAYRLAIDNLRAAIDRLDPDPPPAPPARELHPAVAAALVVLCAVAVSAIVVLVWELAS